MMHEKIYYTNNYHINHPSAIWVRESVSNYFKMYKLYIVRHLQSLQIVMEKYMVQVNHQSL